MLVAILWRDALSVDRGLIDEDHKHLIDLINAIEETVKADRSVGELQGEIEALEKYTRLHFSREEELMMQRRYVKFDEHKAHHHRLVEEFKAVAKPIRDAGKLDVAASMVLAKDELSALITLLRHWLVDHIVKEDLKMKSLLFS